MTKPLKRFLMELRLIRADIVANVGSDKYACPVELSESDLAIISYALGYLRLAEETNQAPSVDIVLGSIGRTSKKLAAAMVDHEPDLDWEAEEEKIRDYLDKIDKAGEN